MSMVVCHCVESNSHSGSQGADENDCESISDVISALQNSRSHLK